MRPHRVGGLFERPPRTFSLEEFMLMEDDVPNITELQGRILNIAELQA